MSTASTTPWPGIASTTLPATVPADKPGWRAAAQEVLRVRTAQARTLHRMALANDVLRLAQDRGAQLVAIFAPLGAEPETRELANTLLVHGIGLAYPRLLPDGSAMHMVACAGPAALRPRPRSRMLEPEGPVTDPSRLDIVVVPTLAVSPQLVRLGRGGGYYDRYLPLLRPDCLSVAAVGAGCVWPWGPLADHDRQLNLACTEHGLFGPAA